MKAITVKALIKKLIDADPNGVVRIHLSRRDDRPYIGEAVNIDHDGREVFLTVLDRSTRRPL
jgi:hypothetical protein